MLEARVAAGAVGHDEDRGGGCSLVEGGGWRGAQSVEFCEDWSGDICSFRRAQRVVFVED